MTVPHIQLNQFGISCESSYSNWPCSFPPSYLLSLTEVIVNSMFSARLFILMSLMKISSLLLKSIPWSTVFSNFLHKGGLSNLMYQFSFQQEFFFILFIKFEQLKIYKKYHWKTREIHLALVIIKKKKKTFVEIFGYWVKHCSRKITFEIL